MQIKAQLTWLLAGELWATVPGILKFSPFRGAMIYVPAKVPSLGGNISTLAAISLQKKGGDGALVSFDPYKK